MRETTTREKGLALVEALTGYEDLDYEGGRRHKSPHAYTHLDAVLGYVPEVQTFIDAEERSYGNPEYQREMATRRDAFLDYLQGVVDALRPEGYGTCGTCAEPDPAIGVCCYLNNRHGIEIDTRKLPPRFGCTFWRDMEKALAEVEKGGDAQ